MQTNYEYDIYIDGHAPRAAQPSKIDIELKPHQLASLHKAMLMETHGCVHYDVQDPAAYLSRHHPSHGRMLQGKYQIESSVGILGDSVGSGKTALALSIIASNPSSNIKLRDNNINSYEGNYGAFIRSTAPFTPAEEPRYINTTLLVVPRGPVYSQFCDAIDNQSSLNVLCIDSVISIKRLMPPPVATDDVIHSFLERYDAVLIKNTALKTLHDYYAMDADGRYRTTPFQAWNRIIVDEACEILNKIPAYYYKFLWMITATYQAMLHSSFGTSTHLSYSLRRVIVNPAALSFVVVKCTDAFVSQSFDVPTPIESYYLCELPRQLAAVHSFLSPAVRERINANDMMGALSLLGAKAECENDIVALVTNEIERDIRNKEREIAYLEGIDAAADVMAARLITPRAELIRLKDKLSSLIARVTALEEQTCTVCLDNFTNPLLLPCNHIFCSRCLISWMQMNHNTCPTCRSPIRSRELIAIVKKEEIAATASASTSSAGASTSSQPTPTLALTGPLSKEETLVNIIQANPAGRFVVFSKLDSSYWGCTSLLTARNITYSLLRGNSNVMASVLDRFKSGQNRVLLLNSQHAGSGIDIACATDMILVHELGADRIQAVGRCSRHPRTTALRIHQLCFPHELAAAPAHTNHNEGRNDDGHNGDEENN